jgi:hypothetical protein
MQDGLYGVVKRNKFLADYTSKKGKMFSNKSLENVQLGVGLPRTSICISRRTSSWASIRRLEVSAPPSQQRVRHPNPILPAEGG